jgi:hypothetical protein
MSGTIYPYRKNIGIKEALEIFTRHTDLPFEQLQPNGGEKPFFVLLYGPPGSGKSYTFAHLSDIIPGVDEEKAVSISLDALAESVGKFRTKTMNAYRAKNMNSLSGIYTSTIRGTYNNSIFNKAPPKPKKGEPIPTKFPSLTEIRLQALDLCIAEGKNIIYERTASSARDDIFQEEIFNKTRGRYQVYVVFPQVDSVEELTGRLAKRVNIMATTKGFARHVPPELAETFLRTHDEYMRAFLLPKLGTEIDALYLVYPSSGRLEKLTAEGKEESTALAPIRVSGGKQKTRKVKYHSRSRRHRRR